MKKILSLVVLVATLQFGFSQISVGSNVTEGKWRVGGGLGLNFGNNGYFGLNIAPSAGYMITPKLEAGVSAGYQYSKSDYYKSNLFSGGPYMNYHVFDGLFARGHFEHFTGNQKILSSNHEISIDESALWLGGGYSTPGPVRFQVGIMYNVLHDEDDSVFSSPVRPFGGVAISL